MRSGHLYINPNKLWSSGNGGYYWESMSGGDEIDVNSFSFNMGDDLYIDDNYNRYVGFSLRCLSTVLDR